MCKWYFHKRLITEIQHVAMYIEYWQLIVEYIHTYTCINGTFYARLITETQICTYIEYWQLILEWQMVCVHM